MKKIALMFMALSMAVSGLMAQPQLSALFGYSVFYLPENNQPYVETYLRFDAWSLFFAQEEQDRYRATVEVTLVARKGDTVAYVKKYDLHSPFTNSVTATNFTFFDLQRFGLSNGIYDLELTLRDKGSNDEPVLIKDKLIVYYPSSAPSMSSIQLMESATPTTTENMLSRNGYDMVPYIDDFMPASVSTIHPYFELYNLDKEIGNNAYTVNVYLEQKENGRRIPNVGETRQGKGASGIKPYYTTIDMSEVPSGNYNIVVEVTNNNGDPLFKKDVTVMRSNPIVTKAEVSEIEVATSFAAQITEEKTLNYYLDALYPVSSAVEVDQVRNLIEQTDMKSKQTFLYRFWKSRNPIDPEGEWNKYLAKLKYVEEHFTYPLTPGYRTDMGRVYLQYGPPDFVRDEKNFVGALNNVKWSQRISTTSYGEGEHANEGLIYYLPYQLWRYNLIPGDYNNRVFIFWDEFRSGYYRLLNSNAMGEVTTPGWERMLSRYTMEEGALGEVGMQFRRGY